MSKKVCTKSFKKKVGIALVSIGLGIIITVIIPFWGFIMVVGALLICLGFKLIDFH
ncbi:MULTISPECIES: hypothetical protein [Clostridium]|uniref:Uncharacterized protein n=2 Tax=Clostridium TaxID=1485 RepID=C6PUV6_9CLOT|nr:MULTISPECIES: hypothetical protein [Clostridium]AKA69955.1 hypothetical protein CSCA_2830 [Clostridium scatologenes]EET86933.1 conserved hypothetical protein [Clostridium carboxidivorans P7]EFG89660.1 hypothetical protein CLCAR_0825 [Clostridium carboxidivorans P7]WPC40730.1 hypothetical protein Q6H37_22980 [Clostridium sp. JS66]